MSGTTSAPRERPSPALWLGAEGRLENAQVGGKAAGLRRLLDAGFSVPAGWVLPVDFFAPTMAAIEQSAAWRSVEQVLDAAHGEPGDELTQRCADVQGQVAELPADTDQLAVLHKLQAWLGDGVVAVRSSSPAEDLAGASFAGQYDSVLSVRAVDLWSAMRTCLASAFDARVLAYRQRQGFAGAAPQMAVIVQHQVEAVSAGVAFSVHPVSNDFDEALINGSWGTGEALVGGQIDPDAWTINKHSGAELAERIGAKGGVRSATPSLDPAQRHTLVEELVRVESLFGDPVDIEWAFDADGQLHILQARPITSYVPVPIAMQTAVGERRVLYMDTNLADLITISGPVTPTTNDLILRMLESTCRACAGDDITLDRNLKTGIAGVGGARFYVNVSNLLPAFNLAALADERRLLDVTAAELYASPVVAAYAEAKPPASLRWYRVWPRLPRVAWRLRRVLRGWLFAWFSPARFQASYDAALADYQAHLQLPTSSAPSAGASVLDFLQAEFDALGRFSEMALAPGLFAYIFGGTKAVNSAIDSGDPEQRRLAELAKSNGEDQVLDLGAKLQALADVLCAGDLDDLDETAARLAAGSAAPALQSAWQSLVAVHGRRGPLEMELAQPAYEEAPRLALDQIVQISAGGLAAAGSAAAAVPARRRQREQAWRSLAAMVSPRQRLALARARAVIERLEEVREAPKLALVEMKSRVRRFLLGVGRAWQADGRLDALDDVFVLRFADIEAGLDDPALDLRAIIARDNVDYEQAKRLVRHFPHCIDSRGRIIRPPRAVVPGALVGISVAPGRVSGPVKVLHNPFEPAVDPGDILVAYTTDPGWTPLFINAAAVVLEVGGELQHGALIAREYGKPCVAGVLGVTEQLTTGQWVEVDGDAGLVRTELEDPRAVSPGG